MVVFKPNAVIAKVGKRKVYVLSAAERKETHTIILLSCVSATGFIVLPVMIYHHKTCPRQGAFPNTLFKSSESVWISSELFVDGFAFFMKSIPPTRPVFLVQDGHIALMFQLN